MSSRGRCRLLLAALLLAAPAAAFAAQVTVHNLDGAGEGFNDPTAVAPVTGNAGTTLGEQRLNALEAAANVWASRLNSAVTIEVDAKMDPLPCTPSGAVLGAAGANNVYANFPNAYKSSTWYPAALANAIAGVDLCPAGGCGIDPVDMGATFNSDVDFNNACLDMTDWYYGIGDVAPAGTVSFYDTVLHEFAHGAGMSTFVDLNDPMDMTFGDELGNMPDIFESFLEDHSTGMLWPAMSSAERATSATDTGDLHWIGDTVRSTCSVLEAGTGSDGHVEMYAPSPFEPGSSVSHWSDVLGPDELMEPAATLTSQSHLTEALFRDMGWSPIVLRVQSAGDVNGGGSDDVALLVADFDTGQYAVYVMDGTSGAQLSKILLPAGVYPVDMEIMESFDGTAAKEVAVLTLDPATDAVQVRIYDAGDGSSLRTLNFAKAYKPFDLEIMSSFGGTAAQEVAVGGRNFTADLLRVTIKDPDGTLLSNVYFSKIRNAVDLEIVPNFADMAADELALALRSCADQSVIVDIKDGDSGTRLNKLYFSKLFIPFDLEILPNTGSIGGTAADEVALAGKRDSDNFVKIRAKDAGNGMQVSEVNFPAANEPIDVEIVPNFAGSGSAEYALLSRARADASIIIKVKDGVSGANLSTTKLSPNRAPQRIGVLADNSGAGGPELAVFTLRQRDNERRAVVIDSSSGATWVSIGLP